MPHKLPEVASLIGLVKVATQILPRCTKFNSKMNQRYSLSLYCCLTNKKIRIKPEAKSRAKQIANHVKQDQCSNIFSNKGNCYSNLIKLVLYIMKPKYAKDVIFINMRKCKGNKQGWKQNWMTLPFSLLRIILKQNKLFLLRGLGLQHLPVPIPSDLVLSYA